MKLAPSRNCSVKQVGRHTKKMSKFDDEWNKSLCLCGPPYEGQLVRWGKLICFLAYLGDKKRMEMRGVADQYSAGIETSILLRRSRCHRQTLCTAPRSV